VTRSSIPDIDELPPESGIAVEDRVAWLRNVVRALWSSKRAHGMRLDSLEDRVAESEKSLGVEGSAAKGRTATGLHLALERAQDETRAQLAAFGVELGEVLKAVHELAADLAADRADRAKRDAIEVAREEVLDGERAPWVAAVGAIVGGIVMFVAHHWH
jgi:hypothetical protein